MGKICFPLGKTESWAHLKFCAYRRIFDITNNSEYLYQLFNVLPKQTISEMKALQVYKFTFNNDFMMSRELNFSVTRNDAGHIFICLVGDLIFKSKLLRSSVEMNVSSINFDKLFKIVSFPASCVICNGDKLLVMQLSYWDILLLAF